MKNQRISENGTPQVDIIAKLVSVSDTFIPNINGKKFLPCTIEFTDKAGKKVKSSGIIYEKNYDHGMEVGTEYFATANLTPKGVLVTVSHLTQTSRPTEDMFDFAVSEETVKA